MDRGGGLRKVRLAEIMTAVSVATDLGMGQPLEQALRVCVLATELGRRLGCPPPALSDIYYVALLEHLGCTATASEIATWNGGDDLAFRSWGILLGHASTGEFLGQFARHVGEGQGLGRRAWLLAGGLAAGNKRFGRLVALQCEAACHLAARLQMSEGVQKGLAHFYERWDGNGTPAGVAGEEVSLAQRVVTVAHDVVIFCRLDGREAALDVVRRRRAGAYDPAVCDALLSGTEMLQGEAGAGDPREMVLGAEPEPTRFLPLSDLDDTIRALGDFADLKAPFLIGHSRRVAELAGAAAAGLGCGPEVASRVRQAGFLHDLGRVGVPNGIWQKPGALNSSERERVRLHSYYTERILAGPAVFAPLAVVAAAHHERLDGSGYHRGVSASQLPVGARLLAVADAYEAMTHDRPYRLALGADQARAALRAEVEAGRLDQRAINAVLEAGGQRPVHIRDAWPAGLSDREVEVLRLLSRGKPNREIAATLVIAPKTVGRHVENLYAKLGVSTRAGAALFAAEHELLE
jgi:HD-GYP domain-containing protein (c-di-GMP phosphodiesterase class II)/DNA-binding CsgD family transcriptional regulator